MATKATVKRRVNAILSDSTKGLFWDDCWAPVTSACKALRAAGYEVYVTNTRYGQDEKGNPIYKVWMIEVTDGQFVFPGILTAHGAGSVEQPLDRYDISAYVS